jgi:hypothetical protein
VGELLFSMRERGLRRPGGGGNQKTPEGHARVSLASLGLTSWTTANRWQMRALNLHRPVYAVGDRAAT